MEKLSLPKFDCKIKQDRGKSFIFDIVRKKYILITPEEWVRQHFVHYMINELGFPKSLITIESGLTYNKMIRRSDIVAYSRNSKPYMLVECKAPDIHLSRKVFEQAVMYNRVLLATFVVLTNGKEHSCFTYISSKNKMEFLETIPSYAG